MARIRSVHPGLFTDEAFMSASAHARLLMIGIWTECWDDGVFEWKPLTLKARLFPTDNIEMGDLLAELTTLNVVREFSHDGRQYGLVRNFARYQRPKKPNSSGLLPPECRTYVGLPPTGGEPVPNQSGTGGGKSPQMEDGGWREGVGKEEEEKTHTPVSGPREDGLTPVGVLEEVLSDGESSNGRYPPAFEDLWREYRPIGPPSSSKAKAFEAWVKLSIPDRQQCWEGLISYVLWVQEQQRHRTDFPAKHLATFVNARGWEPFLERELEAAS